MEAEILKERRGAGQQNDWRMRPCCPGRLNDVCRVLVCRVRN